jgi:N-methylhydantoinase B
VALDAITTQILWQRLIAVTDEAATGLVRTAYSSVVRDYNDYCCGLFDERARLLAHSTKTTAGFIGIIPEVMRHFVERFPPETLHPGDVLMTNDPWLASGHLLDISLATPVFEDDGRILGYALCIVHHLDIGGRLATTESKDMFEEGLKLPIVKLYDRGVVQSALIEILRANVRVPDKVVGDLRAQLAANNVCARGLRQTVRDSGLEKLSDLGDEIVTRSERSLREKIEALPDGIYRNAVTLPPISGCPEDIHIEVALTVKGDEIVIDYTGSSGEVAAALNVPFNMTRSYSTYPIKLALDPAVPNNDGCLKPIKVVAPERTLLNCSPPVATWGRTIITHNLPEIVFGALAKAAPDLVVAGSGSTPLSAIYVHGRKMNGRTFIGVIAHLGGYGAGPNSDGPSCMSFPFNVANIPIEVTETDASILYLKKELVRDSGGPGRHRGGLGQEVAFMIAEGDLAPDGTVTAGIRGSGRHPESNFPVTGLFGGGPGRSEGLFLNDAPLAHGAQRRLKPGDRIEIRLPGGGGYGDPLERDPRRVERDVRLGLVSCQGALTDYGVVVDPHDLVLDEAATKSVRSKFRREAKTAP